MVASIGTVVMLSVESMFLARILNVTKRPSDPTEFQNPAQIDPKTPSSQCHQEVFHE